MNKLAYLIRILTAAPLMAALLVAALYSAAPPLMTDTAHFVWALTCLTGLPLLAYPLSLLRPRWRGRRTQRKMAIAFSVAGYLLGVGYLAVAGGTRQEWIVFLTYILSGLLIAICSFLFRFCASGHACGVAGPIALLVAWFGSRWLVCLLLLTAVWWASLRMKRHTFFQLLVGSLIPLAAEIFWSCIL